MLACQLPLFVSGQCFDILYRGRRCVLDGILSRRSFRGTTAFYFAHFWNWRVKGGVKATEIAGFGCDGEGQR
jgi:hypothetical protein